VIANRSSILLTNFTSDSIRNTGANRNRTSELHDRGDAHSLHHSKRPGRDRGSERVCDIICTDIPSILLPHGKLAKNPFPPTLCRNKHDAYISETRIGNKNKNKNKAKQYSLSYSLSYQECKYHAKGKDVVIFRKSLHIALDCVEFSTRIKFGSTVGTVEVFSDREVISERARQTWARRFGPQPMDRECDVWYRDNGREGGRGRGTYL